MSSLDERPGQDFVVVGDTVNRAARIQAAAPPGGIQISRDTHRHVRGWFSFTAVEPLRLKGIAEPVEAFLVGSERPGRASASTRPVGWRASRPRRSAARARCSASRASSATWSRSSGGGSSPWSATQGWARAGSSSSWIAGWPRSTSGSTGSGGGRRRAAECGQRAAARRRRGQARHPGAGLPGGRPREARGRVRRGLRDGRERPP